MVGKSDSEGRVPGFEIVSHGDVSFWVPSDQALDFVYASIDVNQRYRSGETTFNQYIEERCRIRSSHHAYPCYTYSASAIRHKDVGKEVMNRAEQIDKRNLYLTSGTPKKEKVSVES